MPVTAKLSRRFYERLGDEITNELVEWFNSVDATYRSDLREINEINFDRFDAKVEQRFAESDARIERRFAEFGAKWEKRFAELEAKVGDLRVELHAMKADLIKWMFVFWAVSVLGQVGLIVAVLRH